MLLSKLRLWTQHLVCILLSEWLCVLHLLRWAQLPRDASVRLDGKRGRDLAQEVNQLLQGKLSSLVGCSRDSSSMGYPRRWWVMKTVCDHSTPMRKATQSWEKSTSAARPHMHPTSTRTKTGKPTQLGDKKSGTNFLAEPARNLRFHDPTPSVSDAPKTAELRDLEIFTRKLNINFYIWKLQSNLHWKCQYKSL